jgi:hypothetical protein
MTAISGTTNRTSGESTCLFGAPLHHWVQRTALATSRCAKFIWADVHYSRPKGPRVKALRCPRQPNDSNSRPTPGIGSLRRTTV